MIKPQKGNWLLMWHLPKWKVFDATFSLWIRKMRFIEIILMIQH